MTPTDHDERRRAIYERERNVLIIAGAGTGKTTTIEERILEMLAPTSGAEPLPIERIAAVTFTRRAAGELKLRVRERILRELANPGLPTTRRELLLTALAGLDTAWIGTIHSFADRLLRLHPVEAGLGPAYEVVEDESDLVAETVDVLLHGAENDTFAPEICATIRDVLAAGVRAESASDDWSPRHGLDALVAAFVRKRDLPPTIPAVAPFDVGLFERFAKELAQRVGTIHSESQGARWLKDVAAKVSALSGETDPVTIFRELARPLEAGPSRFPPRKWKEFADDPVAWNVWKAFDGDERKNRVRATALRDDLLGPLRRHFATRLVRIAPLVVELYEAIKARRHAVDQLDLLLRLRDLLARDLTIRGELQQGFDHIFVDEFQDTDPLQAEVLVFLCEKTPRAKSWKNAELAKGKLTIVGDPGQSIYRFRRADVATYDDVCALVSKGDPLVVRLSSNFRSVPGIIEWVNDRFAEILGVAADFEPILDRESGHVKHRLLEAGRKGPRKKRVHVLPFETAGGYKKDDYRELEAEALACYLRWLVTASGLEIEDPTTAENRAIRYGDIAILNVATTKLPLLFEKLDAASVPYSSRGGRLFLEDPLHRQFLLGLRAIADEDDGVAAAALLRPQFFAVSAEDLVTENERAEAARAKVHELRAARFERSPGETARALLEETALGRAVVLGPNGAERLGRLRELGLVLEEVAATRGLDFDGATRVLRSWIDDPAQVDAPRPVGTDAVQVLTVHQAKGCEFPVVVLWDGRADWKGRGDVGAWHVGRDGEGWAIALDGLSWEEGDGGIVEREQRYRDAERQRLVYVACTRARDFLTIPRAGSPAAETICGKLLEGGAPELYRELELYREGAPAPWACFDPIEETAPTIDADTLAASVSARFEEALSEAAKPRFVPVGVATAAREKVTTDSKHEGRFGSAFGITVHGALGLVLRDGLTVPVAVERAAAVAWLEEHLDDARADVERGLAALRAAGLDRADALEVEYPVAGVGVEGPLLAGFIDLLAVRGDEVVLLDFKTDALGDYPEYVEQVESYARLVAPLLGGKTIKKGLLFTAEGEIRWIA